MRQCSEADLTYGDVAGDEERPTTVTDIVTGTLPPPPPDLADTPAWPWAAAAGSDWPGLVAADDKEDAIETGACCDGGVVMSVGRTTGPPAVGGALYRLNGAGAAMLCVSAEP